MAIIPLIVILSVPSLVRFGHDWTVGKDGVMAQRTVYTVSKRASKGWKVKKRGGKVISKTRTKAKAVRKAAKKARKQKRASVVIKGLNGRIQEQRTYPRSRSKAK